LTNDTEPFHCITVIVGHFPSVMG